MRTGYLIHFGVKGQKWGVRRRAKIAARNKARGERRNTLIDRISSKGGMASAELTIAAVRRGQKRVNRILDLMGKDDSRTFKSASRQETAEAYGKYFLLMYGAGLVGTAIAKMV